MSDFENRIRIGTCVHGNAQAPSTIRQILAHGFESFQFTFGHNRFDHDLDLDRLAGEVRDALGDSGAVISAIGVYGNPVANDEAGRQVREGLAKLIEYAAAFGCDLVTGFSGAVDGVAVPESAKAVAATWRPLLDRAGELGVRLAFENCPMGGTWHRVHANTAISADAWQELFGLLPDEHLGLEWEPCHQMIQLVDVLAQLRTWAPRIFHIQGKDATIAHDVLCTTGRDGKERWAWHRTPGFGDLDWSDVVTILRQHDWRGAIDIEGWHDPVYRGDLEMMGQVHGLNYLKRCRGGDWVPNPQV